VIGLGGQLIKPTRKRRGEGSSSLAFWHFSWEGSSVPLLPSSSSQLTKLCPGQMPGENSVVDHLPSMWKALGLIPNTIPLSLPGTPNPRPPAQKKKTKHPCLGRGGEGGVWIDRSLGGTKTQYRRRLRSCYKKGSEAMEGAHGV
jgi:hypothetical protein